MGILEYIKGKKTTTPEETAYPMSKIHIAYSNDGQFVKAFVFNNNNTAIKDLETDKVVQQVLPFKIFEQSKEYLQELYGLPNLNDLTLSYCLSQYAEYGDRLPGKALSGLRQEIKANSREYDLFRRTSQDIVMQGIWKNGFATNTQLQPVLTYLSKKIAKRHQQCEAERQRISDYNDKATSVLDF